MSHLMIFYCSFLAPFSLRTFKIYVPQLHICHMIYPKKKAGDVFGGILEAYD